MWVFGRKIFDVTNFLENDTVGPDDHRILLIVLLAEVVVDDSLDSRSILFGVGLLVIVVGGGEKAVQSFSSLISTMLSSLVGEDTIKASSKVWTIGDKISSVVSYSSDWWGAMVVYCMYGSGGCLQWVALVGLWGVACFNNNSDYIWVIHGNGILRSASPPLQPHLPSSKAVCTSLTII